jgi:hypothetical protein
MARTWTTALVAAVVAVTPLDAQQRNLPDTPEGKLVAGFLAAANSGDEEALVRFQEANFSETALKRRSPEERMARNRQLREQTGGLSVVEVRSASASQIVLVANGVNLPKEVLLVVTFTFTGTPRKIDAVQITQQ